MKLVGLITELVLVVLIIFLISSCAPKHQFQTRSGKKKLNHYNAIQYDQHSVKKMKGIRH